LILLVKSPSHPVTVHAKIVMEQVIPQIINAPYVIQLEVIIHLLIIVEIAIILRILLLDIILLPPYGTNVIFFAKNAQGILQLIIWCASLTHVTLVIIPNQTIWQVVSMVQLSDITLMGRYINYATPLVQLAPQLLIPLITISVILAYLLTIQKKTTWRVVLWNQSLNTTLATRNLWSVLHYVSLAVYSAVALTINVINVSLDIISRKTIHLIASLDLKIIIILELIYTINAIPLAKVVQLPLGVIPIINVLFVKITIILR
jgi:hypothetical protein